MNLHCKILAFCLIVVFVQALDSTTPADDVDYCKQLNAVNENIMVVTPGTYNITQQACVQYFEIQQVNQYAQEKKTLAIEIKITKKPIDPALTPILLVQRRELPVLNFSGGLPSTKGSYATDNYAYANKRDYYFVELNHTDALNLEDNSSIFLGFYEYNLKAFDQPMEYQLTITLNQNLICPQNCGGPERGICKSDGVCRCEGSYLGQYCEVQASRLHLNTSSVLPFNGMETQFFYIFVSEFKGWRGSSPVNDFIIFLIKNSTNKFQLYMNYANNDTNYIPNSMFKTSQILFTDSEFTFRVVADYENYMPPSTTLLLAIQNLNEATSNLTIQLGMVKTKGEVNIFNTLAIIFICITGVLVLSYGLSIITKYRIQREYQSLLALQTVRETQQLTLQLADINKYLPVKEYEHLEKKQDQPTCPICLEDFHLQSKCRQVPICLHIFHEKCVDEWLNNNENCPFCKTSINKSELEKFSRKNHPPQIISNQPGQALPNSIQTALPQPQEIRTAQSSEREDKKKKPETISSPPPKNTEIKMVGMGSTREPIKNIKRPKHSSSAKKEEQLAKHQDSDSEEEEKFSSLPRQQSQDFNLPIDLENEGNEDMVSAERSLTGMNKTGATRDRKKPIPSEELVLAEKSVSKKKEKKKINLGEKQIKDRKYKAVEEKQDRKYKEEKQDRKYKVVDDKQEEIENLEDQPVEIEIYTHEVRSEHEDDDSPK